MKRIVMLLAFSLVVAACSSTGDPTSAVGDDSATSTTQSSSQGASGGKPEGPEAPDFTLALASGESFTLSSEAKPVYMIFWAEW